MTVECSIYDNVSDSAGFNCLLLGVVMMVEVKLFM